MDKVINLRLLTHPVNWGIVWVVALLLFFAWERLHHGLSGDCGCSSPANPD